MIGFIVYSSGMIGFVGLIIPHVVRMLFGTDQQKLVPLCALTGALFLIWADVLCRVIIQGMELPIGILTSMIGAPCFIWLMVRPPVWVWRWRLMEIEAIGIQTILGNAEILKGIDLSIQNKEFVGVIGPNGSGKSTFLKCLYRVLKPQNGAIYIDGRELQKYSVKESARKMAVVAQHNYYNFEFSVQDVVLMGRSPHKKALERDNAEDFRIVEESLEKVGMKDFAKRSFSTLSGGEQQRVILARALAQKTPCLVLDEPTNHLDIKYQLQLMDIVKHLV